MFTYLHLEIFIIALVTAITCVLPGVFLVLRGMAMMSDAISHAIVLGIVIMFLLVQKLESPLLIVGAAVAGVLMVACTEFIIRSQRLKKDAAIGLAFPLFFSVGVIFISLYARNVHLDVDMVLLGEIAFVPFNRIIVDGTDYGPYALWIIGTVLIINAVSIYVCYKELLLTTFDPVFAAMLGTSPVILYYFLMILTSVTAVAAFDIVGSVMVVALMITPASTAYLLTKKVKTMLIMSLLIAVLSTFCGYGLAVCCDVSIAGSIVAVTGVFFVVTLVFASIFH